MPNRKKKKEKERKETPESSEIPGESQGEIPEEPPGAPRIEPPTRVREQRPQSQLDKSKDELIRLLREKERVLAALEERKKEVEDSPELERQTRLNYDAAERALQSRVDLQKLLVKQEILIERRRKFTFPLVNLSAYLLILVHSIRLRHSKLYFRLTTMFYIVMPFVSLHLTIAFCK